MSEGKVNWTYTCPKCKNTFYYGFSAGAAIKICDKCKITELEDEIEELKAELEYEGDNCYCETRRIMMEDRD